VDGITASIMAKALSSTQTVSQKCMMVNGRTASIMAMVLSTTKTVSQKSMLVTGFRAGDTAKELSTTQTAMKSILVNGCSAVMAMAPNTTQTAPSILQTAAVKSKPVHCNDY
jgi:hypothetical protein